MKRTQAVVLGMALVATLGLGPAQAAPHRLTASDAAGDVKINNGFDGLATRARKSIDILRVTITDGDTATRIMVRVRKLVHTQNFVQKFYFDINTNVSNTYASYVFFPQAKGESLIYHQFGGGSDDFELCNEVQPKVLWEEGKVFITVPHRCVPKPVATIRLSTETHPGTEARRLWSSDVVEFAGKMRG
jgi:hypothetical protein